MLIQHDNSLHPLHPLSSYYFVPPSWHHEPSRYPSFSSFASWDSPEPLLLRPLYCLLPLVKNLPSLRRWFEESPRPCRRLSGRYLVQIQWFVRNGRGTNYHGFSPDLGHAGFEIYTIVRLVTQVRGHRRSDRSSLTVSLTYGVWLFSWF